MKTYTKEEIAKARWKMRFLGFAFIAVGMWCMSAEFSCKKSFARALVAMLGGDNCAVAYGWLSFGTGVFLICCSFLKPYQEWNSRHRT